MKNTDKFLIGIVVGIVLLVGVAFVVAFLRPKPSYQPDDTPEGVAHNYLLALKQGDLERAYGYLSPTAPGYPNSLEAFSEDVRDNRWNFNPEGQSAFAVDAARVAGKRAYVTVHETTFSSGGLFESNEYTNSFEIKLKREQAGQWRIIESDSYWVWCWNQRQGCRSS